MLQYSKNKQHIYQSLLIIYFFFFLGNKQTKNTLQFLALKRTSRRLKCLSHSSFETKELSLPKDYYRNIFSNYTKLYP